MSDMTVKDGLCKWDITPSIREKIKNNKPTDMFVLKYDMLEKLRTYWIGEKDYIEIDGKDGFTIPADILWADTIPIKDMIIELDEPIKEDRQRVEDGYIVVTKNIRLIYLQQPSYDIEQRLCMVVVITMSDGTEFAMPVQAIAENEHIDEYEFSNTIWLVPQIGLLKTDQKTYREFFKENTDMSGFNDLYEYAQVQLCCWYGIQIGLLNPAIKLVLDDAAKKHAIVTQKKDRKGKTKTKISYVKLIKLTDKVFDEVLHRSYIRQKLCWYVTGHWRNQPTKTGYKRIFIQGYWKGVLRDSKTSDTRERDMSKTLY